MPRLPLLLTSLPLIALAGCRSSPCALVEAELRSKEQHLRKAHVELERTAAYNEYLQRELRNLRATAGGHPPLIGASSASLVTEIVLGRQTGGYEKDGVPGDELLQVVLEPRDGDGHAIKAPGNVYVRALQVDAHGLKSPLCEWSVTPRQLRRSWRSGLLSTGYFLELPWKNQPSSSTVRVTVRFVGLDNRTFETDKDVMVRVLPKSPNGIAFPPVQLLDPIPGLPPDAVPTAEAPELPLMLPLELEVGPQPSPDEKEPIEKNLPAPTKEPPHAPPSILPAPKPTSADKA